MTLTHEALYESGHLVRRVVQEEKDRDARRACSWISSARAHRANIWEKPTPGKPIRLDERERH